MPDYAIHHLVGPLVRDGMISREQTPSLYETLRDRVEEVNEALFPLTRRVLVDRDLGVAACVTIPAEELERYAESRDLHPVTPISERARLSYFESVIALHFRRFADRTDRGSEWVPVPRLYDAVAGLMPQGMEHNEAMQVSRLSSILRKLETYRLIESRTGSDGEEFRAAPYLLVAVPASEVDRFERSVSDRIRELQDAPQTGAAVQDEQDLFEQGEPA